MGLWRTLYREARIMLGFSPPAETPSQLCERLAREVKGDLRGATVRAVGDDWFLEGRFGDRDAKILFDSAERRVIIQLASTFEEGPLLVLISTASNAPQASGTERRQVVSSLNAEGPAATLDTMDTLWKALNISIRGNLTSFISKHKAEFRYEDGLFRLTPTTPTLQGPSARSNVKQALDTLTSLAADLEGAWASL